MVYQEGFREKKKKKDLGILGRNQALTVHSHLVLPLNG